MDANLDKVALDAVIDKIANDVYYDAKYSSIHAMAKDVQNTLVEFIIKNPSLLNLKHDNI